MEENKKTISLSEFFKKRFFYSVPKEEKEYVRQSVMESDHTSFKIILIIIAILQVIMIVYRLIGSLNKMANKDYWYIICYSVLAVACIIAFFVSDYFYKNKKAKSYFIVVAVQVNIIFAWALAVTLLDCLHGTDLTTYSYCTIAIAALVILEPWIFSLSALCFAIGLNLGIAFIPSLNFYASVVVSSISIAILTAIIGSVNFSRRINSIMLQKEINDLNQTLSKSSTNDPLTNIHNRRFLTEHIDDSLNIGGRPSCVFMFDIDDFKLINDEYGHQVGDQCLESIGEICNAFCKENDNSYAVRYGGEEFLIFFSHSNPATITNKAEQLRQTIQDRLISLNDGSSINITVSIGIAVAHSGLNYSGLINIADQNLYTAKREGKNRVWFK